MNVDRQLPRWQLKSILLGAAVVGVAWLCWTAISGDAPWQSSESPPASSALAGADQKKIENRFAYLNEKAALMRQKAHALRVAAALEFTAEERKIIDEALEQKVDARAAVMHELNSLHRLLQNAATTDSELDEALAVLFDHKKDLLRRLEKIDQQLSSAVSARVRARLLTTGILDNGLGMLAGPREAMPQVEVAAPVRNNVAQ